MVTQPADGGVFEHVRRLATGIQARGHEVVVAGPLGGRRADLGVDVEEVELVRSVAPAADARAAWSLARAVRRVRPDLIHAHSSKAGALARVARAADPRTPVVYTPHGYAFAGYFESERERRLYRGMERVLAPLASIVLCVCEFERRLAASVGPAGRTRVVYNGIPPVEPGSAHPSVEALGRDGPVVGLVTLLRPGKGLETLIDALPALLERHPAASVAVAGDGPDRSALEARARERGVAGALHLIGETRGPGPLLHGVDLFVSPSWAESFPYSILEAMSAGLPVVATDVGGSAEAVIHGTTGLVVPARDSAALAGAIAELLDDRERAAALGEAGRKRVAERFTLDRMIDGTLGVYDEVGVYPRQVAGRPEIPLGG